MIFGFGGSSLKDLFGSSGKSNLERRVNELEEENQRLRGALEFYANPKSWSEAHKYRDTEDCTIFVDTDQVSAVIDKGNVALRALKNK